MGNEGIRIKDKFIKSVDLKRVENAYRKDGFKITSVVRTARCISVKFDYSFDDAGVTCCKYPAEVKVSDDGVTFRWSGISPRQYYHLDSEHKGEVIALQSRCIASWSKFEKVANKEGVS
jgi:hypothetical protein